VPANIEAKSELRIKFFELLFEAQEGYLCLATTQAELPKASFKQRFFRWPTDYKRVENYILDVEEKHNVYFCVNLLNKQERKKENCLPTKLIWADLDSAPLSMVETIPPPILIVTSPGKRQGIWRSSVELPPWQAEDYSHRIAHFVDADGSGWDLTQLFRVPFTKNFKYEDTPEVLLDRALELDSPPLMFERLPQTGDAAILAEQTLPEEFPDIEDILYRYVPYLKHTAFEALYTQELDEDADWSKHLWRIIHICFEVGMEKEEVYVIAAHCPSNKYIRDNRPPEHLWREILKAELQHKNIHTRIAIWKPLVMPKLVEEPATGTILDTYRNWAQGATDAVVQFHDLSCMVLLSALISNSVRLETSYGTMVPNIWGLIIGDSTLTRKTTAMTMVTEILFQLDPEILVATDGSAEGLLTGLSTRPNRASMFYRDEVSGFFESINRKDYLADMPEVLTHLYDVPKFYTRRLRKETIHIESPAFIFFGGGVKERVYEAVTEGYVTSGFLPRFLIVSGETDLDRLRVTGPATEEGKEKRAKILNYMMDLKEQYSVDVPVKIGGESVLMPQRIIAKLTESAWRMYGEFESFLLKEAHNALLRPLALPTFERLSRNILKTGMILAAARQEPKVTKESTTMEIADQDIQNAAWYVQDWGRFSAEMIQNAGKSQKEKVLEKIVSFIGEHPGVLRSVIMQHFKLTKRDADECLGTLEDRGVVRKVRQNRGWAYSIT
jgi:uncharacterized protein DUF3987